MVSSVLVERIYQVVEKINDKINEEVEDVSTVYCCGLVTDGDSIKILFGSEEVWNSEEHFSSSELRINNIYNDTIEAIVQYSKNIQKHSQLFEEKQ